MFISDLRNGEFLDVNFAFCRMLGLSREELIGRSSTDLGIISSEERQYLFEKLNNDGHVLNEDAKFHSRNGKLHYVLYSAEVISLGDRQCVLSTGID